MVLVEEVAGELAHILAVFELGSCNLTSFPEITIFIQDLMNLVFNFCLKIKVFQKSRNHLTYFLSSSIS